MNHNIAIWNEYCQERERAHNYHGSTSMESQSPVSDTRMSILTEEIGEVAKELNNMRHNQHAYNRGAVFVESRRGVQLLRNELIQCGAMITSWIEAIDAQG